MFNDRAYTEITKAEYAQTERALSKLDQAYKNNRMTKAMYLSRRERLVQNLERVISANTPLALNAQEFYGRDELNLSARPTGYQASLEANQELDGQTRKVSQSKIRQAQLQNAYSDVDSESIMDSLQQNSKPLDFQAALNSVNEMQQSQLLGSSSPPNFAGVWRDISNTPSVINSLRNLSDTVHNRVEAAIANGMPVQSAENYIISNARNAGAELTKQGYNRNRAAEIVKSVINGEISLIAAQNIVSADLREITRAVVTQNANFITNPTVSPNSANLNTDKMGINEIVEVRNAALDTLADPLAFEDELEWAASFVNQANNTLNQRANEQNIIKGNSANQILISTEPGNNNVNYGDGMPNYDNQKPSKNITQIPTTLELVQNIPSLNQNSNYEYEQMILLKQKEAAKKAQENNEASKIAQAAQQALLNAQEATRKEAEEKARKDAAIKAQREANNLAKKKSNEAKRVKEVGLKAKLEQEAAEAKRISEEKKKEAAEAAKRQQIENNKKKLALKEIANLKRIENILKAEEAERVREAAKRQQIENNKNKLALKLAQKEANNLLKAKEGKRLKEAANLKKLENNKRQKEANNLELQRQKKEQIQAYLNAQAAANLKNLENKKRQKEEELLFNKETNQDSIFINQSPYSLNRRTPQQKVANALAKLPSQKNVNNTRKHLQTKNMIPKGYENTEYAKPDDKKKDPRILIRKGYENTEYAKPDDKKNDPRLKYREDEEDGILMSLGASTSTTTSTRTSGAYRFQDPRFHHRWD